MLLVRTERFVHLKTSAPFCHFLQQTFSDKAFFYFFVITQITEGLFEGKDSKSSVIILTGFFSKKAWPFFSYFYIKPFKIMIFPRVFYVTLHSLHTEHLQRCEW